MISKVCRKLHAYMIKNKTLVLAYVISSKEVFVVVVEYSQK
jgi:hypothetical protein